jgi:hypothetical protein
VEFLEDVFVLLLGLQYVVLMSIDDQIIVLREDRYQRLFFILRPPWQLLQKAEQLVLINRVSFG